MWACGKGRDACLGDEGMFTAFGCPTACGARLPRYAVPGHTTDAVAIMLAVNSGARKCVIATNVAKVFSDDPRSNPDAEPFDCLTLDQLQEIVGPPEHKGAGSSQVVDPVGVDVAVKNSMPLDILDGRDS